MRQSCWCSAHSYHTFCLVKACSHHMVLLCCPAVLCHPCQHLNHSLSPLAAPVICEAALILQLHLCKPAAANIVTQYCTGCREIDACEPYVKYANGSVISFPETCFYEIDAQAVVTGKRLTHHFIAVASDHTVNSIEWYLTHIDACSVGQFCNFELAPSCSIPPPPPPPGCPLIPPPSKQPAFTAVTYA